MLPWTLRFLCPIELWFSLGVCPGVELLGHMVVLFLVFKGPSILSFTIAIPICIPTNSIRRLHFLHIFCSIYCLRFFYDGHSDWYEVILHIHYDLHTLSKQESCIIRCPDIGYVINNMTVYPNVQCGTIYNS